jgi:hypothetical protein
MGIRQKRIVMALVFSASLSAGAASALPVYVKIAPPAPVVEARIQAPGPGYVWVGGYHRWTGAAYVWVPGRWALPPRPHAVWIDGHWAKTPSGWHWKAGQWR